MTKPFSTKEISDMLGYDITDPLAYAKNLHAYIHEPKVSSIEIVEYLEYMKELLCESLPKGKQGDQIHIRYRRCAYRLLITSSSQDMAGLPRVEIDGGKYAVKIVAKSSEDLQRFGDSVYRKIVQILTEGGE